MRAMLIGSAGPLIGREFSLDKPVVTIGRRDENDIVIKDPTVSRNHAQIRQQGGDLILVDTGSTSGTVVNGTPVTGEHRLRDGDIIIIGGNATFAVQLQPEDEGATIAFSRDQLPGMLPQGEPPDPQTRAAATNYQEAGRTSMMPAIEMPGQQGAEPPSIFGAAPPAPAERAPEPPGMAGGYGDRGAFAPPPPPAQQAQPAPYDAEAASIPPPQTRDAPPAADPWAPPSAPSMPDQPGGANLSGDTMAWPAPPRDQPAGPSGWPPPPPRDERPPSPGGWAPPAPGGFEPAPPPQGQMGAMGQPGGYSPPAPSGQGWQPGPTPPPAMGAPGQAPPSPYPSGPTFASPPAGPAAAPPAPPAPVRRGSRRGLVIGIVAALIIAIGLLVGLTFFLVQRFVDDSALPPEVLGSLLEAVLALALN